MTPLAVLHLSRGREWRGGERQVRLLVETQRSAGAVTPLLVTARGCALAIAIGTGETLHQVTWTFPLDPRALLGAAAAARRLGRRWPGAVVIHAHDSHALQLAIPLARSRRLPLVATRRSDTPPGRLWRWPDRVIAISPAVRDRLIGAGVPSDRIVEIPSAIDPSALDPTALPPGTNDVPTIVAAGALSPEKGHHILLQAFAQVRRRQPRCRLVIVGDGPERSRLASATRVLGLHPHVEFTGELPRATAWIEQATVFVQPSLREALGTALLEALAMGVPCVATAVGGPATLLADDHGELVRPGDAGHLAAGILRLLEDSARRAHLGRRGRLLARRFEATAVAGAVAEVYRSALNRT